MYLQRWHGWCHKNLLQSRRVLCTPYNHAPCHFMQSHIRKVYACLSVTCHLRFCALTTELSPPPSNHTLHTGILAYANKKRFLSPETCSLISTIVHYFQWCPVFKVRSLRDVNFRSCEMDIPYMKINKSPTVSSGVRASSFKIWTTNFAKSLILGTLTNSRSFIFGDSNWIFC